MIVQSVRERRQQTNPLPLILIVFALMCDLMVAVTHLGQGLLASAGNNRFTIPNLLLLVGIVAYAWGHVPDFRDPARPIGRRDGYNASPSAPCSPSS